MFDPKRKATETILGHMGTISAQLRKKRLMEKLHPHAAPAAGAEPFAEPSGPEPVSDEDEAMEKMKALLGH